ncbi:MAG TPA: hypothetical protein ENF23_03790 [Methanosarcinales archaeon]|nr:hypothetical protein [Methanosarcinales archaeon]
MVARLKAKQYKPQPVLRVYIPKFFDTVDHKKLMECLKQRIVDPSLLQLIGRFLKSGIMEEGKYFETEMGTPQGGILSPVLANVYLHYALDKWFEDEVKPQLLGSAQLIRYVDDFVLCFEKESEARAFGDDIRRRMGKFGLTISEEKSKIIEFGRCSCTIAKRHGFKCETFDFNPLPIPKIYHSLYDLKS